MFQRLIHEAVARQATERPDAVALAFRGEQVTYGVLDRAARSYAAELAAHGVGPGHVVPVRLSRSPRLVAALLAVLRCGAAYAALDPRWPAERVRSVLGLVDSPVYVADDRRDAAGSGPGPALASPLMSAPPSGHLDRWERRAVEPGAAAGVTPEAPASVFFTSGTTGTPKGVISPHRATTRLFGPDPGGPLAFGPGHIMTQAAPASWDAFSLELWGMLTTGGTAVLVDDDYLLPDTLASLVASEGVNTAWLTSSLFNLFVELDIDCLTGISTLFIGGERLSPAHVRQFLARHPRARLFNGYGPVESCVFATVHAITPEDCDRPGGIPLGRPVPHTGIHVCDGEIHISGEGLALGYLGDDDLTSARFRTEPVRMYRTGDLGSVDADGTLHFNGRADRQVKIRGYRVEPAEIETVAAALPGVERCVVVPVPGAQPGVFDKLALFYTRSPRPDAPTAPAGSDALGVRRSLTSVLPPYAVPDSVLYVDRIPITPNGKTDNPALLALLIVRPAGA